MRIIAAAGALGVATGLLMYFPDADDGSGSLLAGIAAFAAAVLGLAAASRVRPLPTRTPAERIRLGAIAVGAGVGVGIANLLVNYGLASFDAAIHQQMVTRWAETSSWSILVAGPFLEEIVFRLLLLAGVAWILSRFTSDRRTIFHVALAFSALAFGITHIFYGGVDSPLYVVGMAAKSTAGALAFGWIFWRWGLPYSIFCHCAANTIHLLLMPALF